MTSLSLQWNDNDVIMRSWGVLSCDVCFSSVHVQTAGDVATLRCVCRGISALLTRIHLSSQAVREFPSRHLPSLFSPLLGFAHGDPQLQCTTLPIIAKLLFLYPRAGAQFRVSTLEACLVLTKIATYISLHQHRLL